LRGETERFQNGSVNITVKNIPDSIYRVIKGEAKPQCRDHPGAGNRGSRSAAATAIE